MELLAELSRPEGKQLEFKRDLSSPDGVLRTLVAFSNTAGGVLLIGIGDRRRDVIGISDPLDLEERLASLISDSIVPRLVPEIEIVPWRRRYVIAASVHPSPQRPHYLKREGPEHGVYVRIGSTNRRADASLVEEMKRYSRGESFDEMPMVELDSEAIDFRAASESFADIRPLRKADLESLRLLTRHQGRKVPTVGGILLFGVNRESFFPDAWIQAGRFDGIDKSRILDRAEIRSRPDRAVEETIAFIEKHLLRGADLRATRRQDRWSVPRVAVREAVVNAIVHADYAQRGAPIRASIFDDRLEIENPGILPFGMTIEDVTRGVSRLRNRVIGRVFSELGYVEQWGSGIQRMTAACGAAGLPGPHLEEIGTRFRVTLATTPVATPVADDDTDRSILALLSTAEGRSTSEIAKAIGRSPRSTRTRLARLVDRGLAVEIGSAANDPRRRYVRAT